MRSDPSLTGFHTRNKPRTYPLHQARSDRMPCKSGVALLLLVVSMVAPAIAFAQVPQAGAAGAGEVGDQRHTVWSRQSQRAQRPQRNRKCLEDATARHQLAGAAGYLRTDRLAVATRRDALCGCGRVTAHHRAGSGEIEKASPSRPGRGQYLHRDLPGVLAR